MRLFLFQLDIQPLKCLPEKSAISGLSKTKMNHTGKDIWQVPVNAEEGLCGILTALLPERAWWE
jgi:hypothetical protein